jgi:hypothetical protein
MKGRRGFFSPGRTALGWAEGLIFGLMVFVLALMGGGAEAVVNMEINSGTTLTESNNQYFINGSNVSDLGLATKILGNATDGIIMSGGLSALTGAVNANDNSITVKEITGNYTVIGGVNINTSTGANNNVVNIYTGIGNTTEKKGSVFGGLTNVTEGITQNNKVNLTNGFAGRDVYGGVAINGTTHNSSVYIENGVVGTIVYGGYGAHATNNNVIFTNSNVTFYVIGGQSEGIAVSGSATRVNVDNNTVTIKGASNASRIIGGFLSNDYNALNARISNNTIKIDNHGGKLDIIAGGYAQYSTKGFISENTVEYSAGNATLVAGGYGENNFTGNVTDNKVSVSGGNIDALYGGFIGNKTTNGEVSFNEVYLSANANATNIYGGYAGSSSKNNVFNNSVNITGGEAVNVFGGAAGEKYNGDVSYNIVNITGGNISGNITGGFVDKDSTGGLVINIL